MNRRDFIRNSAVAGTLIGTTGSAAQPRKKSSPTAKAVAAELIDTNVYLSRWPFRRLWLDETPRLAAKLHEHGVTSAWAGSFDAIFHRDIGALNLRTAEECARSGQGILMPLGAVNVALPDWEEDVRRCHEVHGMRGIRLHPNYHGYRLDDPRFARLLELAARRKLLVQIPGVMEDARTQNPIVQVPPVSVEPLIDLLKVLPDARVVLINCLRSEVTNPLLLRRLAAVPQVVFDIAMQEGVSGIERQLAAVPGLRLVFGSFAPFYDFESAEMKLSESILTDNQLQAIRHGNATQFLRSA